MDAAWQSLSQQEQRVALLGTSCAHALLPVDVWAKILKQLPFQDALALRRVCTRYRDLVAEHYVADCGWHAVPTNLLQRETFSRMFRGVHTLRLCSTAQRPTSDTDAVLALRQWHAVRNVRTVDATAWQSPCWISAVAILMPNLRSLTLCGPLDLNTARLFSSVLTDITLVCTSVTQMRGSAAHGMLVRNVAGTLQRLCIRIPPNRREDVNATWLSQVVQPLRAHCCLSVINECANVTLPPMDQWTHICKAVSVTSCTKMTGLVPAASERVALHGPIQGCALPANSACTTLQLHYTGMLLNEATVKEMRACAPLLQMFTWQERRNLKRVTPAGLRSLTGLSIQIPDWAGEVLQIRLPHLLAAQPHVSAPT